MKQGIAGICLFVAGGLCAADKVDDWENLAVNSRNRMPACSYLPPLSDAKAALCNDLEYATDFKLSLNGDWKFYWVGDPSQRPTDFWQIAFDDSRWSLIDVPCCVEMRGYGTPHYTNINYPHKNEWPKILDRASGTADYNPVSSYRRTFTIPENWNGRDIVLRFDGVYSAYYVWVNGEQVGYAEDSHLPSEFDITKYVKLGANNTIAVQVFRWSDGSYLEDQDMFRFSGIYRDVTLLARPKAGIADFKVVTAFDDKFENATFNLELSTYGSNAEKPSATLYDASFNVVAELAADQAKTSLALSTWSIPIKNVNLWSAEKPYLYTLVMKCGSDIRAKRIGFKDQRIIGNTFFVNGKAIKLKGVNRHETNPEEGRSVSLADMLRDIKLMKLYNINTVRTSHYPDHHLWYDLCDMYGLYVIAEANVEGHEPGYGEKGLGLFKEWEHSIVERNVRHVMFYRNHPSVTIWSMGNETGHGPCFKKALAQVKAIDPTRPTHWERGNSDADIDSSMYPSVEWLIERGKLGDKPVGSAKQEYWPKENYMSAGKPYIMCEYAHAMGNAMGNFQEYWDAVYSYPSLVGGCVWDWIDQALWKETSRVDPKTGHVEKFLSYGGDYDDIPNDGPFCNNGIINPLREITPKLIETGHVYRNLIVRKLDNGKLELENRFGFTDACEFDGKWELVNDGKVVASEAFEVPSVKALSKTQFEIPELTEALSKHGANGECFANISFHTKKPELYATAGWAIARNQLSFSADYWALAKQNTTPANKAVAKMGVLEDAQTLEVEFGRTSALFSKKTGTISKLVLKGNVVIFDDPAVGLASGPQLTCARAFTDNDRYMTTAANIGGKMKRGFFDAGFAQLRYHPEPFVVDGNTVKTVINITSMKSGGFKHECDYTFAEDGSVTVESRVTPYGDMPFALPRLGLTMRLPARFEHLRYYGRGPIENYIDRCTASFVGVYNSTVKEQFVSYVRPQDNGYKSDVRWVEFYDNYGRGARFSASEPLFMQALHYGWEDLAFSRHQNGQPRFRTPLVERQEVMLNLDVRQLGLGGASCGPWPMAKYKFDPNKSVSWSMKIEPVRINKANR